jgi:group I intron endonuclease
MLTKNPIIYKTTNIINGKIYIGQDFHNKPNYLGSGVRLRSAIKHYGRENFKKEILEYCSLEELNDKESYWIAYYNSMNLEIGYNLTSGGHQNSIVSEHSIVKLKGRKLSRDRKSVV